MRKERTRSGYTALSQSIIRLKDAAAASHWSDCAMHDGPAMEAGPCDCGAVKAGSRFWSSLYRLACIRVSHWRTRLRSQTDLGSR